jgi:hypothetical protein
MGAGSDWFSLILERKSAERDGRDFHEINISEHARRHRKCEIQVRWVGLCEKYDKDTIN